MAGAGSYDDFLAALRQRESGNNYKAVNSYGYLGAYQFGEAALIDLGYVPRDGNNYDNVFSSGFLGKNGINSRQAFLDSPREQDAAAVAWFSLLWGRIRAADLEFYAGQTLNGVLLTKSGMLAAVHLLGTGGLSTFIKSGGISYQKDGYGTSIVDYLKRFAGYDTPSAFLDNVEKANTLKGGSGADVFVGGAGNDAIDGGAGIDTARYGGTAAAARIVQSGSQLAVTTAAGGTDSLAGIERLAFDDGMIAFDKDGNAGRAYRLYQAAFDRVPDPSGLGYWIRQLDAGKGDLAWMANNFIISEEFKAKYGTPATVSDSAFLDLVYQNVLHRGPDDGGKAYWLDQLGHGFARERVLASFSESAENQATVSAAIADGIWYV